MQIKALFDPAKDIYRTIEKVISYNASQEDRLRAEIREYIATESIEEQIEKLLGKMQAAMELSGQSEVGVWVSGFYGSGKSSFTKYLGLALDEQVVVDDVRFLEHLADRLQRPQSKALLRTVSRRYPAAVVMLDLASEMLAGARMEDVSTVLYYKVLQWAGFSRNLKVAALERRLQQDGRYGELTERIQNDLGLSWREVQNDALAIDSLLPEIAHDLYPDLFRTPTAFTTETSEFVHSLKDQVKEMLDVVRRKSGRERVIFVVDEVGQYVSDRKHLILNLQGLAENLKNVGDGKAWIIGTAQQTLTEDDPRAALNSPELYKLKDRFPIQIDLESRDIKEICVKRLLGKSSAGEDALGALFDHHGQALRHNTRLQDARFYDADFDRTTFVNLYPFLPAHFDILLHLLGALAKSTGGIGLRSAIKIVQDILVEGVVGQPPMADQPVGSLVTTVTLYDALEKDIRRAFPSIHRSVEKSSLRFVHSPLAQEVIKTVAVLQILGNLPVTAQNVTSLMHPAVDAPTRRAAVDAIIQEMIAEPLTPFGEKDNGLCFFSEKINDIDQARAALPLRSIDTRKIHHDALRELFSPLPSTKLNGTLTVTSGLGVAAGASSVNLAGERETIQTVVEFVAPADFEATRTRLIDESRQRSAQHTIFLLGRSSAEMYEKTADIYRCREIVQHHRNDPDQEVRDYCRDQQERAARLTGDLEHLLRRSLSEGSLVFRGQISAVESFASDAVEATRRFLGGVAEQVFDRYSEAPVRVDTAIAERLLRIGNLRAVTAAIDPLGLVQISGGSSTINVEHKALVSLRDYLDRNGAVEGKRLTDHFTDAPFGWSPDTLRYLAAALLMAGAIKLKVSGREITVVGQQAIEALRTNNSFRNVGVSLRDARIPIEILAKAAQRLTELSGESVLPYPEDEISRAAIKHFPQFQFRFGPLAERLAALELPGADKVRSLNQQLAELLLGDASDAPQRLGGETSPLYDDLKWAGEVDRALKSGLEQTVRELQRHRRVIGDLRDSGAPGQLRSSLAEELEQIAQRLSQPSFFLHAAELNTLLTTVKARTRDAAIAMRGSLAETVREAQEELIHLLDWDELYPTEQSQRLAQLEDLVMEGAPDLSGLQASLHQEAEVWARLYALKKESAQLGQERRSARRQQEEAERKAKDGNLKLLRTVHVPARLTNADQLANVVVKLTELQREIEREKYVAIDVTVELS